MPNFIDLLGLRVGRLVVERRAPPKGNLVAWHCRCDCGAEIVVTSHALKRAGRPTESCGCKKRDATVSRNLKHGAATRAGLTSTYSSWAAAKARCYKACNNHYAQYGGRGITMCDRWHYDFGSFLADMGEKPAGYSLDRIDPNGDYEPGNCRWATASEQAKNRRTFNNPEHLRYLTAHGETLSVPQWARRLGMNVATLHGRIRRGYTDEQVLTHERHPGVRPSDEPRASPAKE